MAQLANLLVAACRRAAVVLINALARRPRRAQRVREAGADQTYKSLADGVTGAVCGGSGTSFPRHTVESLWPPARSMPVNEAQSPRRHHDDDTAGLLGVLDPDVSHLLHRVG